MIHEIHLQSKRRDEMIDITAQVEKLLVQENVQEGLIVVYSSHTTAGIMINENADPDVQKDILRRLGEITHGLRRGSAPRGEFCRPLESKYGRNIPSRHYS